MKIQSNTRPNRPKFGRTILGTILVILTIQLTQQTAKVDASLAMKRLYEEIFTDYNKLIIPIAPNKTRVTITLGLKLGQILDLNLKQQILSTNVWVEQTWHDHRLEWDPKLFEGINMVHVPAESIWIPDIVLFNNADGNYELTLVAKANLYSNGTVVWKPPTMFRSTCEIDVEYFPFDIQTCFLRFGSWTYAGDEVEIRHVSQKRRKIDIGIDLSQFYKNVEWDIIDVPAYYNENYYECCQEPYPDITFKIAMRRKILFYLVNLILPVALMTFMTVLVFYLPADSYEKVTLSISILTSLIVFFLLMLEVIPPSSLTVPLFGKYLLVTLILVSFSAVVSVYVLNVYHRAPSVHQMPPWMRRLFLKTLPRVLRIDRPDPRERSSLNRFRKKKIAQQILQARQHNKVYDLAQPLAASLNLIETLHKSYEVSMKEDTHQSKADRKHSGGDMSFMSEDDEEGRYFRRYVDNYIDQLESKEVSKQNSLIRFNERSNQQGRSSLKASRRCENQSCCRNSLSNQHSWAKADGQGLSQSINQNASDQLLAQSKQQPPNWTTESSGGMLRPLAPTTASHLFTSHLGDSQPAANSCKECLCKSSTNLAATIHHPNLGILNDDTLDMTFDYDDQEEGNNNIANSANLHGRSLNRTLLDDLPSPPPPPRQLTQLSDSMKDLSAGRLSACNVQHPLQRLGQSCENDTEDDDLLVGKLIKSVNLINNASDDMDATTTTNATTSNTGSLTKVIETNNNCIACSCQPKRPNDMELRTQQTQNQHSTTGLATRTNAENSSLGASSISCLKPSEMLLSLRLPYDQMPAHVRAAIRSILFIADTIKNEDDENSAREDWESVSMVVDRLSLWIFLFLCILGSSLLCLAPPLYDNSDSIDDVLRIVIPPSNCSAMIIK